MTINTEVHSTGHFSPDQKWQTNQPTDESDREAEHCFQTEKEASIFKALPQSSTTEQNDLSLMSL